MRWSCYAFFLLFSNIAYAQFPPKRNCNNTEFECDDGQCVSKTQWCERYGNRYCRDSSNLANCGNYYPNCVRNQLFCSENRKCIPLAWACDGYKDCPAGSDETECLIEGYRIKDIPGVETSREKAKSWLLQKRRDWGWKKDTARAIVALYFSNVKEFAPEDLSGALMVKELRLQIAEYLLRNNSKPVSTYQLALFINALLATCQNPRNFFNFNFVEELLQRVKIKTSASINPFVALTLCNANETISDVYVAQLLELYFRRMKPERIDSLALASMALSCLRNRNGSFIKSSINAIYNGRLAVNRTFSNSMCRGLQLEDGSFGSVYSTALMLQALLAEPKERTGCNVTDAVSFLISKQKENAAFDDIISTYLALPPLYGKTLIDLGNVKCSNVSSNLTVQEEFDSRDTGKQNVECSIQVGIKEVMFSMDLRVPVNATFYDVMRLAAELDPRYSFKYVSYPWGKFIYHIFDKVNDAEARKYWKLYRITGEEATYLEEAPDRIITKDNESYMYWYTPTD